MYSKFLSPELSYIPVLARVPSIPNYSDFLLRLRLRLRLMTVSSRPGQLSTEADASCQPPRSSLALNSPAQPREYNTFRIALEVSPDKVYQ